MKTIYSFLFLLIFLQITDAQINDTSFTHHVFQSEAFGEERKITVHLPSRYLERPNDSMMVTYVLDAQGPQYFNMIAANLDYLTSRYGIIPTIVVGIHSKNRYAEFTPPAREGTKNENDAKFESKLPNLYDHFENEVFPWVEANYRTKPFRAIVGHSRGGSFVIQSLFDGHKDMFDAYLAISPSLQFDSYQSIDLAEETLTSETPVNKFLYTSSGGMGDHELFFDNNVNKLDMVIRSNPDPSLNYHRSFFPDKDHFTTVSPSLHQGMVLLKNAHMVSFENIYEYAKDTTMSISEQMDQFINKKKAQNSFIHEPVLRYYTYQAEQFFESDDYKNALDLYQWVDKQETIEKWWEILNIGICHKHLGRTDLAQKYCDEALLKLENWKEEYGERFEKIKANVIEQIEELME